MYALEKQFSYKASTFLQNGLRLKPDIHIGKLKYDALFERSSEND